MACIHIIEGPVGAGKTTYALKLGQELRTSPLVLDDWMVTLFSPDRPDGEIWEWYRVRKNRCFEQIWKTALGLLTHNSDVIVELGLLQRQSRLDFYNRIEDAKIGYKVHVLEMSADVRWDRVQARNRNKGITFSMDVPEEVFTLASSLWEAPDGEEIELHNVVFVND